MAFSCKIILSEHPKQDGMRMVYLRAILDRKKADVPLGFYLTDDSFDERHARMKSNHANAKSYDAEFLAAIAKANDIASKFRLESKPLTPDNFREEFSSKVQVIDLIKFMKTELELKRPDLAANTYKQHNTAINKLSAFRPTLHFHDLGSDTMKQFRNAMIKKENLGSTQNKILRIVKQYLIMARKQGIKFKDPFEAIKIKNFKSNRVSLSQNEVDKMDAYFQSEGCIRRHKKVLRYFLFCCYTGLRISDVKVITWNNIHENLLIFTPVKTKALQKDVTVPLGSIDRKYLPAYRKGPIFETNADQVTNRYLKEIADKLGIHKRVTFHTSRHTFGTLFAEGGNIAALQRIMGHGDIKTTMGYVHLSTKTLVDAKQERFGQ